MSHLRTSAFAWLTGACLIVASACDDTDPTTTTAPTSTPAPTGAAGALGEGRGASVNVPAADAGQVIGALSDPEIVSVLSTSNAGAVERSTIATDAAESDSVRAWAEEISAEHLAAQERLTALVASGTIENALNIGEAENAVSQELQATSQRVVQQLRDTTGQGFDALYLQAQIDAHTRLIELIDTVLLPNVDNLGLRAELQRVRAATARHLQRAQALLAARGGADDQDAGVPDTDAGI